MNFNKKLKQIGQFIILVVGLYLKTLEKSIKTYQYILFISDFYCIVFNTISMGFHLVFILLYFFITIIKNSLKIT